MQWPRPSLQRVFVLRSNTSKSEVVLEVEIDTLSRPHTSHDVIRNGMSLVVGVVGPELPDSFAENIVTSLRRMGHRAELLGSIYPFPGSAALSAGVDLARKVSRVDVRLQKRVVKRVRRLRPHLVINV